MLLRRVQASDRSGWAPHPALSRCGAAAARVGTRCPVIGANGGADGFRRIARQTGITANKLRTGAGEVLTTEAGVRPGVGTGRMGAEATMAVDGAIPSVAAGHEAATVVDERRVRVRHSTPITPGPGNG